MFQGLGCSTWRRPRAMPQQPLPPARAALCEQLSVRWLHHANTRFLEILERKSLKCFEMRTSVKYLRFCFPRSAAGTKTVNGF